MNNEKDLLSVKEFSSIVKLSRQSIYQKLESQLKDFVVVVNGKKMLKKSALSQFKDTDKKVSKNDLEILNILKQENVRLEKELDNKTEEIKELYRLLDQEQQLHLLEKKKVLELEDKLKAPETVEPEPEKKKWWKRLFE